MNGRDHKGKTALHRAAQAGFVEITALLLDRGADLEAADRQGETPLFDVVRYGRPEALALLFDRGARVDHENRLGQTVAQLAKRSRKKRVDEVRALLAERP